MKLKKKHLRMVLLVLLALFAYTFLIAGDNANILSNEDFIRFHVVANSDSDKDQMLKLAVRDGLLESINDDLVAETMAEVVSDKEKATLDIDRTKEFIERNLTELEIKASDILSGSGCFLPVKAELITDFVPRKTYGNITFPAGSYNALKVTIGEGRGENWWCVLFPPLCLIGLDPEGEKTSDDLYKEVILSQKYKTLVEDSEKPRTLKLKFKLKEMRSLIS